MARDPRYPTLAASSKLVLSGISIRFRELQSTFLGSREDFDAPGPPVQNSSGIVKTRAFQAFLAVFVGYSPCFWGPGGFRCLVTPCTKL